LPRSFSRGRPDGVWGPETAGALAEWAKKTGFRVDYPGRIHATDAETAWAIRESAREELEK
jgi:hypothetical protein